jgi:hypothetical protein
VDEDATGSLNFAQMRDPQERTRIAKIPEGGRFAVA